MAFGATDIPPRGVDDFREDFASSRGGTGQRKKQRDVILTDIRKAQVAAEKGDKRQLFDLAGLNKQDQAEGRLVLSIGRQIAEAKKRVVWRRIRPWRCGRQAWTMHRMSRDKLFEVAAPDGRRVRHRGASQEDVRRRLQFGYALVGQVHGADADGIGGFVPRPGFLTAMLEAYEGELIEWLEARGLSVAAMTRRHERELNDGMKGNIT